MVLVAPLNRVFMNVKCIVPMTIVSNLQDLKLKKNLRDLYIPENALKKGFPLNVAYKTKKRIVTMGGRKVDTLARFLVSYVMFRETPFPAHSQR